MRKKELIKEIVDLACNAFNLEEIPVGAIIVKDDKIIAKGINDRHKNKSVIGHAEINAIEEACKILGDWRLDECEMYVTLFPCMMCTGAILESRIKKVYYLCDRTNVCYDVGKYLCIEKINDNVSEKKCLDLLQLFFENKRN